MSFLKIHNLVANNILTTDLSPPKTSMSEMNNYVKNLHSSADRDDKVYLGDVLDNASLHFRDEFSWLTSQIESLVNVYLYKAGFDVDNIACFHQKSWPVITQDEGFIKPHTHPNADLSCVFYLQCPPESGGHILFNSSNDILKEGSIDGKVFRGSISRSQYGIKPFPGLLCIFPSSLEHRVSPYTGDSPRYSITYDIFITTRSSLGPGKSENFVVHPSYWKEFSSVRSEANSEINQPKSYRESYSNTSLDIYSDYNKFLDDGFIVKPSFFDSDLCNALMLETINSWNSIRSDIKSPNYRIHSPLLLSDISLVALRKVTSHFFSLLDQFLSTSNDLVELSSICSFPGAASQELHRDHSTYGKRLITIFANLFDTDISSGALHVCPGSHKLPFDDPASNFDHLEKQPIVFPAGSLCIMNGSLVHCGGANSSNNKIRPVWYCTFGDSDIFGPAYSIHSEVSDKYNLLSFQ